MKKKTITNIISLLLLLSIAGNLFLFNQCRPKVDSEEAWNLSFENANSWDTYFTVHNVRQAQEQSTGKGVKVGVIDHYFGCSDHSNLYAGGIDLLGKQDDHDKISEHGYWLACTLREIAPECEIYAISAIPRSDDEKDRAEGVVKAIDWAIENGIQVLTYSNAMFEEAQNQELVEKAIQKATEHSIVTTFIHCDYENNLYPTGMYEPVRDITIFSYDYNLLLLDYFNEYGNGKASSIEDIMIYYSNSSMSVVSAGFVALLMELRPDLTPQDYKTILIESARDYTIHEPVTMKEMRLSKVADIKTAITYMEQNY